MGALYVTGNPSCSCTQRAACDVWVLEEAGEKRCLLKANDGLDAKFESRVGFVSGTQEKRCKCVDSVSKTCLRHQAYGACPVKDAGRFYKGRTIAKLIPAESDDSTTWRYEECSIKCTQSKGCDVWVLELTAERRCILKSNTGASPEFEARANVVGGTKDFECKCVTLTTPSTTTTSTATTTTTTTTPSPTCSSTQRLGACTVNFNRRVYDGAVLRELGPAASTDRTAFTWQECSARCTQDTNCSVWSVTHRPDLGCLCAGGQSLIARLARTWLPLRHSG